MKRHIEDIATLSTAKELDTPHIELDSNGQAVVEGCRGIIEYDGNVVRINCGRLIVRFCGDRLTINALSQDVIMVSGSIVSLEFCT